MSTEIPKVAPIDIRECKDKNSKSDRMPTRMLFVASSTAGSIYPELNIQRILLREFTVYIVSSSVHVDDTWTALKKCTSDVTRCCRKSSLIMRNMTQ